MNERVRGDTFRAEGVCGRHSDHSDKRSDKMMRLSRSTEPDGGGGASGTLICTMDRSEIEHRLSYSQWRPRRKQAPLAYVQSRRLLPLPVMRSSIKAAVARDSVPPTAAARRHHQRNRLPWTAWRAALGLEIAAMTGRALALMDELVGPDQYDRAKMAADFEQLCYDTFDHRIPIDMLSRK